VLAGLILAQGAGNDPGGGQGLTIIAVTLVAVVVAFALLLWLLGVARRRGRTSPGETHAPGDVGRVAGGGEAAAQAQGRRSEPGGSDSG
jgi:hypothetical protein